MKSFCKMSNTEYLLTNQGIAIGSIYLICFSEFITLSGINPI